jgi:hypothetical protein
MYKRVLHIYITILLLVFITFIFNVETSVLNIVSNSKKEYEKSSFLFRFLFYPVIGYLTYLSYTQNILLLCVMYIIILIQHIRSDSNSKMYFSHKMHIYPLLFGLLFIYVGNCNNVIHPIIIGGTMAYIHTIALILNE